MFLKVIRKLNDRRFFIVLSVLVFTLMIIPFINIIYNFFQPHSPFYLAIIEKRRIHAGLINTIELILKVGLLSAFIGFTLAYILTFYNIKHSKIWKIIMVIPLCIPVYVAAYTYSNIYFYLPWLEAITRSNFMMNGAVFIYAMFLYPYVFLASKAYLSKHLTNYIEVSKTLGKTNRHIFFKVILPLSRPIIIGSVLFTLFETLSDFAVVEFYGVLTLSRYINLSWFATGDFISASKFSLYILIIMFVLLFLERASRKNKKYTDSDSIQRPIKKTKPQGFVRLLIYGFMSLVATLSFVLPMIQLIVSSIINYEISSQLNLIQISTNTLIITIISIAVILVVALLLTTMTIYLKGYKKQVISSFSTIGYVVPSMVLALGLYLFFIQVDQQIYKWFSSFGLNRMLITSSITIIIIGFFVKFFSIAYTNLLSAYNKTDLSLLDASITLGETKISTLIRVTIPMLKKSIIAVTIILFIDMFKELTIIYSLRPFNFKTLSTEVYRYAGNEMINVAALPSLVIIVLCSILVIYLEGGFSNAKAK